MLDSTPSAHIVELASGLQDDCSHLNLQLLCLFVCFIALRPKSKAMGMAGRSVHLTTLFPGQA